MRPHRQSFDIDGVPHAAPIPAGARVGNMLFSSALIGADPATGELPDDIGKQAEFVFGNMVALLAAAGGAVEDVGHVRVLLQDDSHRNVVNQQWLRYFPDPKNRPARHTLVTPLRGGMLVQLEIIAVLP